MQDELAERRHSRNKQQLGDALLRHLGEDFEGLERIIEDLTDTAPPEIREAMAEAFEGGKMIHSMHVEEAAREDCPGYCANAVCRNWVQSEGEEEIPSDLGFVEIRQTGRESFCGLGNHEAYGCLFRMKLPPPNSLCGVTGEPLPEWSDAIDMLRHAGLLEPDEFGKYNGTDFALQGNFRIVWWALVELLVETGRIEKEWVHDEKRDRGTESRKAKELLFPSASE